MIVAANKIDAIYTEEGAEDPVVRLKRELEPLGVKVFPISAVTGEGLDNLIRYTHQMLSEMPEEVLTFEQEYFPEEHIRPNSLPFTVERSEEEENVFIVEGPKIEKMLGYTNLDAEKGFTFFQIFLKDNGILKQLEELGIQDGDTVRMYGLSFEYYK